MGINWANGSQYMKANGQRIGPMGHNKKANEGRAARRMFECLTLTLILFIFPTGNPMFVYLGIRFQYFLSEESYPTLLSIESKINGV